MKLFLNVIDKGDLLQVTSITSGNKINYLQSEGIIQIYDIDVWEYIGNQLADGKSVKYPKIINDELQISDLIIDENLDDIEKAQLLSKIKCQNAVLTRFSMINLFDFYQYTILNNKLNSLGYFITEENREEKYLEIINENNEDTLKLLEKYLIAFDKLHDCLFLYNQYNENIENIENSNSVDEINDICNDYLNIIS